MKLLAWPSSVAHPDGKSEDAEHGRKLPQPSIDHLDVEILLIVPLIARKMVCNTAVKLFTQLSELLSKVLLCGIGRTKQRLGR